MKKRGISFLLVISIISAMLCALPLNAFGASRGTCGDNLTWRLDTNGILTISGSGAMTNWSFHSSVPWYSERTNINQVVIGNNVTTIGGYAFRDCDSLTSIDIPNNVTTIEMYAFSYCDSLTSVSLGNSLTTIGDYAFRDCESLTCISLGNSVTTIGDFAFYACDSLTSIDIPDSVTTIGDWAFCTCDSLTSVSLGNSATTFGRGAFVSCYSLTSISADNNNPYYTSVNGVLFNKAKTALVCYPAGKTATSYDIPSSVTTIGDYAFRDCESLTCISLGNSVTTIGNYAFSYCDSLTDIFYSGTEEEWENIVVDALGNEDLENATVHYEFTDVGAFSVDYLNGHGNYKLYPGEKATLKFSVNAFIYSVSYSSNNTSVATVDNIGIVTAKKAGTAVVTAYITNLWTKDCLKLKFNIYVHNISDFYKDFEYSFNNINPLNFGESNYVIPAERYMQAGCCSTLEEAKKLENEKGFWGHCYGMSASSILFFKNILKEEQYDPSVNYPRQFGLPKYNPKLLHMIEKFTVAQFNNTINTEYNFNYQDINIELTNGNPVLLTMYGKSVDPNQENWTSYAAHAIVLYDYTLQNNIITYSFYDNEGRISKITYDRLTDKLNISGDLLVSLIYWYHFTYIPVNNLVDMKNTIELRHSGGSRPFSLKNNSYSTITRTTSNFIFEKHNKNVLEIQNGDMINKNDDVYWHFAPLSNQSELHNYIFQTTVGTYSIQGSNLNTVTTSISNEYGSVEIICDDNVKLSSDKTLKNIELTTQENDEYSVNFTNHNNAFERINLSGVADSTVKITITDSDVIVTGTNTLNIVTSVSEKESSLYVENLHGEEITISTHINDDGTSYLQVFTNETPLSDNISIGKRKKTPLPTYDLSSGDYEISQLLTFPKEADTIIYYTTDGSVPSADNGIMYTMAIEINKSMNIKAVATKFGYVDSDILELSYTLPDIMEPIADYESGDYSEVTTVRLRAKDNLTDIYYTMDGSDPFENGELYTIPLIITKDCDIRAYAVKNGVISDETEYSYTINSTHPLYLVNTPTTQDGELITNENIASLSKINLVIEKLKDEEVQTTFLVAFYDENNKLLSIERTEKLISEETNDVEITVEKSITSAAKLKVFMWSNLSELQPLSMAEEFLIS